MVGPFLEFYEFKNWIDLTGPYADLPIGKLTNIGPALARMGQGFLCMFLHILVTVVLGFSVYRCGTKEYLSYGFFYKVLCFHLGMTSQRFMYYSAWCLSDAAMIACGLAYSG
jgi:hypothetical protein